jgi:hypothetical protein
MHSTMPRLMLAQQGFDAPQSQQMSLPAILATCAALLQTHVNLMLYCRGYKVEDYQRCKITRHTYTELVALVTAAMARSAPCGRARPGSRLSRSGRDPDEVTVDVLLAVYIHTHTRY